MMQNMSDKISFDFDGVLSEDDVQEFAKSLIADGYEGWIVTSREDENLKSNIAYPWIGARNEQMYKIAEEVGIPRDRILFTTYRDKVEFINGQGFLFHLDDDEIELEFLVYSGDPCKPVNKNMPNWKEMCLEALGK